jgi:hypothetical protein
MVDGSLTRHSVIVVASVVLAFVVVLVAAGVGGSYVLGVMALHNNSNLSVTQACDHWKRLYKAAAEDRTPATRSADAWIMEQLKCPK